MLAMDTGNAVVFATDGKPLRTTGIQISQMDARGKSAESKKCFRHCFRQVGSRHDGLVSRASDVIRSSGIGQKSPCGVESENAHDSRTRMVAVAIDRDQSKAQRPFGNGSLENVET